MTPSYLVRDTGSFWLAQEPEFTHAAIRKADFSIYGVLLLADMNAATLPGAQDRSVIPLLVEYTAAAKPIRCDCFIWNILLYFDFEYVAAASWRHRYRR